MKQDPSTPKRSLIKGICWETLSTLLTTALAYVMFNGVGICIVFGIISFIMKIVLYYWHERMWHQISWGKNGHNNY